MHLNIWYVLLVTGRPGRTLLLIFLTLRLLPSRMPYNISLFVAQIFVRCGNVSLATAQTLRKTTCKRTYRVDISIDICRCYSSLIHLQNYTLHRTAGICFLAVASSFLRGSAHLRGLVYVSSENKRTGDTPESMGERRKTEAHREKTEVPHRDLY